MSSQKRKGLVKSWRSARMTTPSNAAHGEQQNVSRVLLCICRCPLLSVPIGTGKTAIMHVLTVKQQAPTASFCTVPCPQNSSYRCICSRCHEGSSRCAAPSPQLENAVRLSKEIALSERLQDKVASMSRTILRLIERHKELQAQVRRLSQRQRRHCKLSVRTFLVVLPVARCGYSVLFCYYSYSESKLLSSEG